MPRRTTRNLRVAGFGDVIFDHVFRMTVDGNVYEGSRGGGPVWNSLVALSRLGATCTAIGVRGGDPYGASAVQEMEYFGIDCSRVRAAPRLRTLQVFQCRSMKEHGAPIHEFHTECPICGFRIPDEGIARITTVHGKIPLNIADFDAICLDRLTRDRADLAIQARQQGVLSALDLGRIGHLRYVPVARILAQLDSFDFVQMPKEVHASVVRRSGEGQWIRQLKTVSVACVTDGSKGATLWVRRNGSWITRKLRAPKTTKVVDTAGAGDVLFAALVSQMARRWDGFGRYLLSASALRPDLSRIPKVLSAVGARGDLRYLADSAKEMRRLMALKNSKERKLVDLLQATGGCPICATPLNVSTATYARDRVTKRRPPEQRFRRNVVQLVDRALFSLERDDAIQRCRELLEGLGSTCVVGTGGSFPAATFIGQAVTPFARAPVAVMRPFDYVRTEIRCNSLIVVTYSGSTPDCGAAIREALRRDVRRIILVTRAQQPTLGSMMRDIDEVVSYGSRTTRTKERGFVSVAATVQPCVVWAAASASVDQTARVLLSVQEHAEQISASGHQIADSLKAERRLFLFGGGYSWPSLLDLEGKITEGGLATVQSHESKDFSHGRFMLVMAQDQKRVPRIFVGHRPLDAYEEELMKAIRTRGATPVMLLAEQQGILGGLENLVQVQYFLRGLVAELGLDISRPLHIPRQGLRLYHWGRGR